MKRNLKCPRCGWIVAVSTLCSNPPQYECECRHVCGVGLRYFQRKDPFAEITQEELDKAFPKEGLNES